MILKFIIKNTEELGERFAREPTAMLVCLCKGVSDKKIRSLVENGASSVRQVMSTCHAGQDCGACICTVRDIIRQTRSESAASDAGADHSDE